MNRAARAVEALTRATRRLGRFTARRLRDLGLPPNPLRRRSDRLEAYARLVALLLWVAAVPLAIATGSAVHRAMDADAAGRSAWPAVVLSDVPDPTGRDGWLPRTAAVQWTTPAGVQHTTTTRIPPGAQRGTHFTLWTDAHGQPTTAPLAPAIRWTDAFLAAVGVLLSALALLELALLVLRGVLDRQRYRAWDLEWLEDGASQPRRGDGLR